MKKQKIIPVIAIPVAVFVILFVIFPSLFIPSYKAYEPISVEMDISGIKEAYGHGEPIFFAANDEVLGWRYGLLE